MNQVQEKKKPSLKIEIVIVLSVFSFIFIEFILGNFLSGFLPLISTVFYFFIATLYKNNLIRFFVILFIALIFTNLIITVISLETGYALIFNIFSILLSVPYVFFGALLMKLYYFVADKTLEKSTLKKRIPLFIFGIIFILSYFLIAEGLSKDHKVLNEIKKRDDFIENFLFAINNDEIKDFNNQELINLDLVKDIYKVKDNEIKHGYNGVFEIKKVDNEIYLRYKDIPAKETCFTFYYTNDPSSYGFSETRIDGMKEEYGEGGIIHSYMIDDFKRRACYSGKKTVTIEFVGNLNDIEKKSKWRMR